MHLRQLVVENFRAIKGSSISFEDAMGQIRPVSVLAGPNGCGKTSILFAVYRALSGAMGYHSNDVPDASDEEIFRDGGAGNWSFQPNRASVRLDLEYEPEETEAAPKLLEATRVLQNRRAEGKPLSVPTLPGRRITVTWQYPPAQNPDGSFKSPAYVRTNVKGGATWLSLPKFAIRGWNHRPRPLIDLSLLDKIGILRLFAQNRGKRWAALDEVSAFPPDEDDWIESSESADRERSRSERPRRRAPSVAFILKVLADNARGMRLADAPHQDDSEQRLRAEFERICAPKRYIGYVYYGSNDVTGTPLLQEGDRQYPLSMAATGEQVILDYLTQFVYPRPVNNSLILIDEPELHLHPKWVRQLYRALPQMGHGNQFIMTTHSPELRQLAAEDNALIDMGSLTDPRSGAERA